MSGVIDLRSDTVTRPSAGMRRAIAEADVGDDQYGEDPSVNRLQERIAELLGKEAAVFVPSGTMANQIALRILTRPGDDVMLGHETHMVWHESGAGAANAGVQFTAIGQGGLFTEPEFRAAYKAPGHMMLPPTTLVAIENTHNRGGGLVFPPAECTAICRTAHNLGARAYLDGARLFNAAIASDKTAKELSAPFDVVSVSVSKGLGCPVGSLIAGTRGDMTRAVRMRRMLGGAMRQAGVLAAAGLYALDNNLGRLSEDHMNAQLIASSLAGLPQLRFDPSTVQTNIVIFHMVDSAPDAAAIAARAKEAGVLVTVFGPRTLRAVAHLDVTADECRRAGEILAGLVARR
jgi:threonine aldolase